MFAMRIESDGEVLLRRRYRWTLCGKFMGFFMVWVNLQGELIADA